MESPSIEIIHQETTVTVGIIGSVFINAWHGKAIDAPVARRFVEMQKRYLADRDGLGFHALTLVDVARMGMIDRHARKMLTKHDKAMQDIMRSQAQVVLGRGLLAKSVRAIMASVAAINRPPYPIRIVSGLEEGVDFVRKYEREIGRPEFVEAARQTLAASR